MSVGEDRTYPLIEFPYQPHWCSLGVVLLSHLEAVLTEELEEIYLSDRPKSMAFEEKIEKRARDVALQSAYSDLSAALRKLRIVGNEAVEALELTARATDIVFDMIP